MRESSRWLISRLLCARDVSENRYPIGYNFSPPIMFHYKYFIPILGRIFLGSGDAHRYLLDSTEAFLFVNELSSQHF